MAIAQIKPTRQEVPGRDIPLIQPNSYKGVVVDLKQIPEQSLLTYTNGYDWKCDYFSQVINSGNDLKALDTSQSKVYQQYKKINGLVIRVDDPLSESQDDETKLMTVSGSGMVVNGLVPEVGDMFIADVGTGSAGIFTILNTERKSYYTQSVFQIDYTLLAYVKNSPDRVMDLESKVVENLYYNRLYNQYHNSQLLSSQQYLAQKSLSQHLSSFINYFFDNFWSPNYSTVIIPKQNFPIYDSFMLRFLLKILDVLDHYNLQQLRILNIHGDCGLAKNTILNVLINKQVSLLPDCKKYMGLASTAYFAGNPLMLSIAYSGIAYTVYPVLNSINPGVLENDPMTYWGYSFNGPLTNMPSALTGDCSGLPLSEHHLHNELITYNATTIANVNMPLIKPAFFSNAYIFSSDFYNQTGNYSVLEMLVWKYLKNEAIDEKLLNMVCDDFINWTQFDIFYFMPILILLIKYTLKGQ